MDRFRTIIGLYKHSIFQSEVFLRSDSSFHRGFRRFTSLTTNLAPSTCRTLLFGTHKHSSSVPDYHFTQLNKYDRRIQALPLFTGTAAMATFTEADGRPGATLSDMASISWKEGNIEAFPTNGLRYLGPPFDLENYYDYESGGHHPVHLGDTLGTGRYQVIHKLGSGGTANVWLCRDLKIDIPTYVALKILMSDVSTEDCPELVQGGLLKACQTEDGAGAVCLFLDHFKLDGPNGTHFCFVYPLLGPPLSKGYLGPSVDLDKTLRESCRVTVQAMAFLHSKGICHGG